jgi:hypothetical protein
MLMVISPKPRTPKFVGTNPPTFAFETHRSIGNQWCEEDFHPWISTLELIIALPEQHYNYPSHITQLCLHIRPMPMKTLPFGLRG